MNTISEIKDSIMSDFMSNENIASAYGFTTGSSFYDYFSKVSVESLLFYIVAVAIYTVESLFVQHKNDVGEEIESIMPHRAKWYRDKVLSFMKDKVLITDTDEYDTASMSDAEIEACKVVKYATATENTEASILTIKVAGEIDGTRCPIDQDTQTQLMSYISYIKDAGVRVSLVNQIADVFNCEISVYYDAQKTASDVESAIRKSISYYIANLPFNGEYSNMSLVDALQQVEGVKIVEIKNASAMVSGDSTVTEINAKYTPFAGYFTAGHSIKIEMNVYE